MTANGMHVFPSEFFQTVKPASINMQNNLSIYRTRAEFPAIRWIHGHFQQLLSPFQPGPGAVAAAMRGEFFPGAWGGT